MSARCALLSAAPPMAAFDVFKINHVMALIEHSSRHLAACPGCTRSSRVLVVNKTGGWRRSFRTF
jgi:hypothetical protein